MVQLRIILFGMLCVCEVWCERGTWLNPSNFHVYDHANKVMRTTEQSAMEDRTHGVASKDLQECRTALHNLQHTTNTQEFSNELLLGKLQRQTAFVLQAAELLEEGSEGMGLYIHRHLLLSLSREQLRVLRHFATSGQLDFNAIDAAWHDMWSLLEDPSHSKWAWLTCWLPDINFVDNKERVIFAMEVTAVLMPMVLLLLDMSLLRVFLIFVLLVFTTSVMVRYHRISQANEMRQRHLITDPMKMPSECRPYSRTNWEMFKHFFSTDVYDAQQCARYYEVTFTDPLTQTTPLEQMMQVLMDGCEIAALRTGSALSSFSDAVFADLPWPLNVLVGTVTKLVGVIVIILVLLLMMWLCLKESFFGMLRGCFTRSPLQAKVPPQEQASSHFHITNHGPLVLGNATSGIEILDNKHAKLGRAQSDSSIQFSSQSVSSSDQSEGMSRLRSASNSYVKSEKTPLLRDGGHLCTVAEDTTEFHSVKDYISFPDVKHEAIKENTKLRWYSHCDPYCEPKNLNKNVKTSSRPLKSHIAYAQRVVSNSPPPDDGKSSKKPVEFPLSVSPILDSKSEILDAHFSDCVTYETSYKTADLTVQKISCTCNPELEISDKLFLCHDLDACKPTTPEELFFVDSSKHKTQSKDSGLTGVNSKPDTLGSSDSEYSTPVKSPLRHMDSDTSLSPSQSELSTFLETLNLDESISELLQTPILSVTEDMSTLDVDSEGKK